MPPQIYATAMPLADLRTAELLLITTLRLYAANWRRCAVCSWRTGLETAGIDDRIVDDFSHLFVIIAAAPRRKLDVGWPHCPFLSPDEGRLLQLVGLLQRNRTEEASAILGDWITPTAARLALPPAMSLAQGFNRQGLLIPPRHRTDVALNRTEHAQFGEALLH